jgi:hypothetical protein
MREGTTSRVTAAVRPYGEFYDFYSVSPENFGSTLVFKQLIDLPCPIQSHDLSTELFENREFACKSEMKDLFTGVIF